MAVRYADVPWQIEPGAAAKDSELSTGRPLRILGWTVLIVVLIVPIVHPLRYVPQRVVQTELVGAFLADFVDSVAILVQSLQSLSETDHTAYGIRFICPQ